MEPAVCPVCKQPSDVFVRATFLVCRPCSQLRPVKGFTGRLGGGFSHSLPPAVPSGDTLLSANGAGGERHHVPGPFADPRLMTHLEAGGKRVGPFDGLLMWALFWAALILTAYALWMRGWFWTDTTSKRRDFVGFVLLAGFGSLLSLLVGL